MQNTKIIISDSDNDSFSANYRLPLVKNYISSGSPYEFYMKNIHEDTFLSFNINFLCILRNT